MGEDETGKGESSFLNSCGLVAPGKRDNIPSHDRSWNEVP